MAFQRTDATLRWLRTPAAMLAPIRDNGDGASAFAWIRHTSSGASPRVGWGSAGSAEPRLIANNNNGVLRGLYAQSGSTLITGTTTAGLNTWFPIAVSYRMIAGNGHVRAVGNQALLTVTPAARAATEALVQFTVGQDPGDNVVTDTGEFAHAAAWNIALSDEEMQALNRGANPLRIRPGNLVGYWPLDSDGRNLATPLWPLNPAGSATSAPVWVPGPPGIEPPQGPAIWLYAAPVAGGVTGTASGELPITGSATGTARVAGTASGTLPITGSATGTVRVAGTASGTLPITGSATGAVRVAGTASGDLPITGSAAGVVGNPPVTGTASGTLPITGAATGVVLVRGAAAGALPITGSASGAVLVRGTASGVLPITGSATGGQGLPATAVAHGTLPITGSARGVVGALRLPAQPRMPRTDAATRPSRAGATARPARAPASPRSIM